MLKIDNFFKSGHHNSRWFYFILFFVVVILTNVRQKMITNFNCEICSDKAGYYMYLPAFFQLGFNAKNYPEGFDSQHGDGFHIDKQKDKVLTKFTCGVALLLSPFYVLGIMVAKIFSIEVSPYSKYYLFFINLGAAFYLVTGLFYLRRWLNFYVDSISSFWTILVIFFGTNLFYYTLDESLMSHLYSFSLFSILLFSLKSFFETDKFKHFIVFIISLSLAILIRPTNVLFVVIALLTDVNSIETLINKLRQLLKPKYFFSGLFMFLLIISPQLIYWNFAFGKYLVWSYTGEGFTLWNNPEFLIVWFSPQSGLFTYTPIILLSLIFSVIMLFKKEPNAILVMFSFLLVSYMCASWYNPLFGICNFGKRPMIEYFPIIMLPISYMFSRYNSYQKTLKWVILISVILFVFYNQALFGGFNTCFFGQTWEWEKFGLLLKKSITI